MAVENSLLEIPCVNEKLTEIRVVKRGCRKRNQIKFSAKEIVIIEKFEENQAILLVKFIRTNVQSKARSCVWETAAN